MTTSQPLDFALEARLKFDGYIKVFRKIHTVRPRVLELEQMFGQKTSDLPLVLKDQELDSNKGYKKLSVRTFREFTMYHDE